MHFIIVFIIVKSAQAFTEPCETNNYIDNWKRSTAYEPKDGRFLCDSLTNEDWYRVTSGSGELMPTYCLELGWRCGTVKPIYLSNESLSEEEIFPSDGQVVNRTAYAVDDWNCKAQEYTIRIKNCTHYLVYYLKRTINCNTAYCFGSERPCPSGESSKNGYTPGCSTVFPNITLKPTITVDLFRETKNSKIYETPRFYCWAPEATENYTYDIMYYINEVPIRSATYTHVPFSAINNASLLQTHWELVFKPNMLVKCSMQARYIDRGAPGKKHFSDVYFAGMKVVDGYSGFVVKENEQRDIKIEVTLPIGCSYRDESKKILCYVGLRNGVPKYQRDDKCVTENNLNFGPESCQLQIFHSNWSSIHKLTITGKSDSIINKQDRLVYLRLYTGGSLHHTDVDVLRMWDALILPDVKIYIRDSDDQSLGKACYSRNDPHMQTFDGKTWELQGATNRGEYVMYKHDSLPQQINAYFLPCNPRYDALCNCGIAVRSGNSLFIANFCETGPITNRRTNRYVASRFCDDQNLIVHEQGDSKYEIILPSGTIVDFTHGEVQFTTKEVTYGIYKINIQASMLDFGYTSGLCGRFNDDAGDDFADKTQIVSSDSSIFAESWKILDGSDETFFDPTKNLPPLTYKLQEYCTCNVPTNIQDPGETFPADFTCRRSDQVHTCGDSDLSTTVYHGSCLSSAHNRGKRSTDTLVDDDAPPMFPMTSDLDNTVVREPPGWKNGLSEQIARNTCKSYINALPAFDACSDYVPTISADTFIEECVADMKLIGSDSFLQVTLQNFESSCLQDGKRIENLTDTNITSPMGEIKSIFSVISESTCPNNCSGKGICTTGICSCVAGSFGRDCSIDKRQSPRLQRNAFENFCDSYTKRCNKFVIPGMDFVAENLTCRFRRFAVSANNSVLMDLEVFTNPGTYWSSFLMYCELPKARRRRSIETDTIATGYQISVSNDGKNFTEELTMLIFDTRCFECNAILINCTELDSCPVNTKSPTGDGYLLKLLLIAVGIPGVLVITSVIVICVVKQRRKRNSSSSESKVYHEMDNANTGDLSISNHVYDTLSETITERRYANEDYQCQPMKAA